MDRLENCTVLADICAGGQTKTANQTCTQVGNDIAVKVGADQNIIFLRVHHQTHTHGIDNAVCKFDLRIFLCNLSCNIQKQTVCAFHDVCLMYGCYFFSSFSYGIFKGVTADALAALSGNQLDAFRRILANHVFNPCIQVFCIFAHDNKVNMIISCDYAGIGFGRAHVCIKVKSFAQCYVYAAEALADRGRNRPFQRNTVLADGINDMVGQGRAVFFNHGCACFHFIPFNGNAGCLYNALRCCNNLRAAAVPGDKSYFMCHIILPPLYSSADRLRAECRTVLRKYSVLWGFLRRYAPVLPLRSVPLLRL